MRVEIAKDATEWNSIVERSPFSVLHHRYEACVYEDKAIPLIIREKTHSFLFPVRILSLFKSFRLATSSISFFASIIPDNEKAIDLMSEALDCVVHFMQKMKVDYLSTCPPAFLSQQYTTALNFWFKKKKADVQIIFIHSIPTKDTKFEDVFNRQFEKRARNRIRKAKKKGVRVIKIDTIDDFYRWIDDIYKCNLSALKRQGRLGAYPDSYREAFLSELISTKKHLGECYNIYGAIYKEHLIAYMVIREDRKLMQVSKAMSHTSFLNVCPNEALIAYLIKEACKKGVYWFVYGFDRVKRDGKIPSLYPSLQRFKFKFGFEEIPVPIYRLGLTRAGKMFQHLYSARENFIIRSAYIPESYREFFLRIYRPRHRKFFSFLQI